MAGDPAGRIPESVFDGRAGARASVSLFALASVAAVGTILYLGRDLTFWQDEWNFINDRTPWTIDSFLIPHNEHWVSGIALLWWPLLETVGMRDYWPYLLVLSLFHVMAAAAVFRFYSHQFNAWAALAASACLLFLGTAGEDLFWAFQVGFVGSTAAGAWAVVLFLEAAGRRRLALVSVLLVVAVAMSGIGLFFLAAIAAVVVLSRPRRAQSWVLLPPLIAFLGWMVTYGHAGNHTDYGAAVREFVDVAGFVKVGVETAVGNLIGVGPEVGLIVAVILGLALAWSLVSRGPVVEGAVAGTAGLVSQFLVTGITRAPLFGAGAAIASRYGYPAAVFVLIAVGAWIGARPRSRRSGLVMTLTIVGLALLSLSANLPALERWRDRFLEETHETRAAISIMSEYGGSPAIPADRFRATGSDPSLGSLPGPGGLVTLVDKAGLELADYTSGSPPIPPESYDRALFHLVTDSFSASSAPALPTTGIPLRLSSSADVEVTEDGACFTVTPIGPEPQVIFAAPGGAILHAAIPPDSGAQVFLALRHAPQEAASRTIASAAPSVTTIGIPDLGSDTIWQVRFDPPVVAETHLCLSLADAGA